MLLQIAIFDARTKEIIRLFFTKHFVQNTLQATLPYETPRITIRLVLFSMHNSVRIRSVSAGRVLFAEHWARH